jgi:uncharacterized protein YycO
VKGLQNADVIFQTSKSSQSKAIQLATKSKYSHMGIVYKKVDQFFVLEAVQPVKMTPLQTWIKRGEGEHYVVKRLKNSSKVLTPEVLTKMKEVAREFLGKDYDIYFEWSDDKIYCSELVWKIYKRAAKVELGQPETLSSFDLSSQAVRKKMKERYGNNIPLNETVISPAAMFTSEQLITVLER